MPAISQLRTFARYARFFKDFREEQRTRRLIAELPASVRKDIGWPDGYTTQPRAPR